MGCDNFLELTPFVNIAQCQLLFFVQVPRIMIEMQIMFYVRTDLKFQLIQVIFKNKYVYFCTALKI